MRFHLSRFPAFVALIAALTAVSGLAPPRQGGTPGRDRDRVLRPRGGLQRLDAPEGAAHTHDEHDLAPAPPGDTLLIAGLRSAAPRTSTAPAPLLAASPFALQPPLAPTSVALARKRVPATLSQYACAPGRAPPQA